MTSVEKIFHPDETHYTLLTVVIIAVAIITKLLLGAYTKKMGRETESSALTASGADATFDAVISAGTLAGALVTMTTSYVIDGWIGCVISVVILKAGLEMLLDTLSSIVGRRADTQLAQELKTRLCAIDGILGAYDLVLHNYGPTRAMGSVNVAVYDWRTAADLHALSKKAQAILWEEYRIYLYIGFYAVNTQDAALRALEDQVRGACKAYPEVLSIHAFFENPQTGEISFDGRGGLRLPGQPGPWCARWRPTWPPSTPAAGLPSKWTGLTATNPQEDTPMFLETTPEGKIYRELAEDHFADPAGLGKFALFLRPSQGDLIPAPEMEPSLLLSGRYRPVTLEGRNLFVTKDFYAFFKHLEEPGIEATHKGVVVIAMNKLREVLLEAPEVLDNARLTADGKTLYLIKNKRTNLE